MSPGTEYPEAAASSISCEGVGGCSAPCECVSCDVACFTGCAVGCEPLCLGDPSLTVASHSGVETSGHTAESGIVDAGNQAMNNSGVDKYVEHIAAILMYPWYWF